MGYLDQIEDRVNSFWGRNIPYIWTSDTVVVNPSSEFLILCSNVNQKQIDSMVQHTRRNGIFEINPVGNTDQHLLLHYKFNAFQGQVNPDAQYENPIGAYISRIPVIRDLGAELYVSIPEDKRDLPFFQLRAIAKWLEANFTYSRDHPANSETALKTRSTNCVGYSNTFTDLARFFGIPCEPVSVIQILNGRVSPPTQRKKNFADYVFSQTNDLADRIYGPGASERQMWVSAYRGFKSTSKTSAEFRELSKNEGLHAIVKATLPQGIAYIEPQRGNRWSRFKEDCGFDISIGQISRDHLMLIEMGDIIYPETAQVLKSLVPNPGLETVISKFFREDNPAHLQETRRIITSLSTVTLADLSNRPWWTVDDKLKTKSMELGWNRMGERELYFSLKAKDVPVEVFEVFRGKVFDSDLVEKWLFEQLFEMREKRFDKDPKKTEQPVSNLKQTSSPKPTPHNGHLFVSYSGLLYKLGGGSVDPESLDGGIFYFGCPEGYLSDDNNDALQAALRGSKTDDKKRRLTTAHKAIVKAAMTAQEEGRGHFRQEDQRSSFDDLFCLLERNGVNVDKDENQRTFRYNYPNVRDLLEPSLNVVF
jgi:hypothetical protein